MANRLYESFMGRPAVPAPQPRQQVTPQPKQNNMFQIMERFNQFKQTLTGNPKDQVMQLLNSGQVSKEQYDQAVQMANTFRSFF